MTPRGTRRAKPRIKIHDSIASTESAVINAFVLHKMSRYSLGPAQVNLFLRLSRMRKCAMKIRGSKEPIRLRGGRLAYTLIISLTRWISYPLPLKMAVRKTEVTDRMARAIMETDAIIEYEDVTFADREEYLAFGLGMGFEHILRQLRQRKEASEEQENREGLRWLKHFRRWRLRVSAS